MEKTKINKTWKITNLCEEAKDVFLKLGFAELENTRRHYYANPKMGKIYRVKGTNTLREMGDGVTPDRYGKVNIQQLDGKHKTLYVHRIIASFLPHAPECTEVDHLNGKDHNGIDELEWVTHKENMRRCHERKRNGAVNNQ